MAETPFNELLLRVRRGDEQAATELVDRYQPHIQRLIRVRLANPTLRRQVDSTDICQSVMADFFVRAAVGQFELESPQQLVGLLSTMAKNKIAKTAAKNYAARRDIRRVLDVDGDTDPNLFPSTESTPSARCSRKDLVAAVRSRLSERDRQIAELRALGKSWMEIGIELGVSADALRIRFTRVANRIATELGV
ncbi:MAG: sigma-70 family RNA polymerase sigma factor [Planctomycetota bacterium]|nr:sigma-70 family RNA polymerase sigma factor [Planctomycetota bacterium]